MKESSVCEMNNTSSPWPKKGQDFIRLFSYTRMQLVIVTFPVGDNVAAAEQQIQLLLVRTRYHNTPTRSFTCKKPLYGRNQTPRRRTHAALKQFAHTER